MVVPIGHLNLKVTHWQEKPGFSGLICRFCLWAALPRASSGQAIQGFGPHSSGCFAPFLSLPHGQGYKSSGLVSWLIDLAYFVTFAASFHQGRFFRQIPLQ